MAEELYENEPNWHEFNRAWDKSTKSWRNDLAVVVTIRTLAGVEVSDGTVVLASQDQKGNYGGYTPATSAIVAGTDYIVTTIVGGEVHRTETLKCVKRGKV